MNYFQNGITPPHPRTDSNFPHDANLKFTEKLTPLTIWNRFPHHEKPSAFFKLCLGTFAMCGPYVLDRTIPKLFLGGIVQRRKQVHLRLEFFAAAGQQSLHLC